MNYLTAIREKIAQANEAELRVIWNFVKEYIDALGREAA